MFFGKVHQITTSLLRKIVKNTQTAKMRKCYRLKHQKLIRQILTNFLCHRMNNYVRT